MVRETSPLRRLVALGALLGVVAASAVTPAAATTADTVAGHGIDANNRNVSSAAQLALPLREAWHTDLRSCSTEFGNTVDTISVTDGMVYTADQQWQCGYLSAYDARTGKLKWRVSGGYSSGSARYHDGAIYWAHQPTMNRPQLTVLDARTGKWRWSRAVPSQGVVVGDGVVLNGDTAYDTATRALRWKLGERTTSPLRPTNVIHPAIVGGIAYLNSSLSVRAVNAATGTVLWRYRKTRANSMAGAGSASPVLHGGRVYIRSAFPTLMTLVLDATTGRYVKRLPASEKPFAITGTTMIAESIERVNDRITHQFVSNIDTTTGKSRWSRKLPMARKDAVLTTVLHLALLINGNLVWAATGETESTDETETSAGRLIAYDLRTGKVRWSTDLPCPVRYDIDEPGHLSNMAIAHGHLYLPTNCGLLAYKAAD